MDAAAVITAACALAGALGGVELVKLIIHRKADGRKANASASGEEFRALKEYNDFLQARLVEKEQRFEEQTQLVRRLNAEIIDLTRHAGQQDLLIARKRCDDDLCPYRQPPTPLTPPAPGITKDEYHKTKRQRNADTD